MVDGDGAVQHVTLVVKLDLAHHAIVLNGGQCRQEFLRISRVGLLHGGGHQLGGVVSVRGVQLHFAVLGLELLVEGGKARQLFLRHTGVGSELAFSGVSSQLDEFRGLEAVAADQLGGDAQLLDLLGHRAGLRVHAAKEDHVRLGALDRGQDGHEVGGGVGGELALDDFHALALGGFFHFVSQTLAVSGAVVNDGDFLGFQGVGDEITDGLALLHIVRDHTEGALEALGGVSRVGGGRRDLHDAGVRVHLGSRDGGAGVQVADHGGHLGVHQALGHLGGDFRVGLVVFGDQLELDLLATDGHAFGVQFVNSQLDAGFAVLAQVGDRTGQRGNLTQLHHQFAAGGGSRGGGLFSRLLFTLAASGQCQDSGGDKAQTRILHENVPL